MIVRAAPKEHYSWLTTRAGLVASPEFRAIEAVDGERIVGMVGYDSWTPNGVFMSTALDEPIAMRALLPHAFRYPFEEAGREVAIAVVRSDNERSLRLVRRLGFRRVYAVRDGWAKGVDLVLHELRREHCRWSDA